MQRLRKVGTLNVLLAFVPITLGLKFAGVSDTVVFITSAVAIIPLAGLMGKSTEMLADRLGPGIGGLLNASFGNAAELIIALFALHKGLLGVVKASTTGSIIGNILFVLGASFLAGGIKHRRQTFNPTAAGMSALAGDLRDSGDRLLPPSSSHCRQQQRARSGWSVADVCSPVEVVVEAANHWGFPVFDLAF